MTKPTAADMNMGHIFRFSVVMIGINLNTVINSTTPGSFLGYTY